MNYIYIIIIIMNFGELGAYQFVDVPALYLHNMFVHIFIFIRTNEIVYIFDAGDFLLLLLCFILLRRLLIKRFTSSRIGFWRQCTMYASASVLCTYHYTCNRHLIIILFGFNVIIQYTANIRSHLHLWIQTNGGANFRR